MSELNSLYDRNHQFAIGFDQADLYLDAVERIFQREDAEGTRFFIQRLGDAQILPVIVRLPALVFALEGFDEVGASYHAGAVSG